MGFLADNDNDTVDEDIGDWDNISSELVTPEIVGIIIVIMIVVLITITIIVVALKNQ